MTFRFLEVTDPELLEKVHKFRYEIVNNEYKFSDYVESHEFTEEKDIDIYDKHSVHFAALDENNEVSASVRLIHHSPIGYPTENHMKFDIDKSIFDRDKLGEVSRIFIAPEYRNLRSTKIIMDYVKKYVYLKMKEAGIEYSYGALEKSFIRLLKIYKMGYEMIGEEQLYAGLRYPCILYTDKLEKDNPELPTLWKEQNEPKKFKQAI